MPEKLEKKQVLVICRSAAGQMYLGVLLNRIWYTPVLTKTAEEGVKLARTNQFTLIAFDGDLPETELRSALSLLRVHESVKDIPLAVFLSSNSPVSTEEFIGAGCSAVLTKPLDLALVFGVLGRLSGQPRSTHRVTAKIRVEIAEGTPERFLSGVDISEGGIYLRTTEPLQTGSVIHLRFTLPRDAERIETGAKVVRHIPLSSQLETQPGMGLQFIDPTPAITQKLRNFVQWEMIGDLEWEATF